MTSVTIDRRFNGPPNSVNGGYAAGVAGARLVGVATVTLRRPPPLETPLEVFDDDEGLTLRLDDEVIVEARRDVLDLDVPAPVEVTAAHDAATRYPSLTDHAFPTCFVCGPERAEGDGLRIFSGPVAGRDDVWAAPWTPTPDLAVDGEVAPEVVWASLDCPSYFAVGRGEVMAVLGRLTAELEAPVEVERPHVLLSWPLGIDGRKLYGGSAVLDADGRVLARARATWIELAAT